MKIYDSVFSATDAEACRIVYNLFRLEKTKDKFQRQIGTDDCGAFAIAAATAIGFDSSVHIQQEKIWSHLLACFRKQYHFQLRLNND